MGDSEGDSEQEALRALELADGYLEDAENVLWTAAIETNAEQVCVPLEELTEQIWEIQQQLYDLQDQIEE
jgi:hypothetical protein